MNEARQEINNQETVAGQVGTNYGTVNQYFGGRSGDPLPSPTKPVWTVPYCRNPVFTGHEDLLNQIHNYLVQSTQTQPLAITGLGGIGKTQIAIEYTYRYYAEYHYILWIRASSRKTLDFHL